MRRYNCGVCKRIIFEDEVAEIDAEGNFVCFDCFDQEKAEKEQEEKDKEED